MTDPRTSHVATPAPIPIEDITSPEDRFRCAPYSCVLSAGACVKRQHDALGDVTSRCRHCSDGGRVKALLGAEDMPETTPCVVCTRTPTRGGRCSVHRALIGGSVAGMKQPRGRSRSLPLADGEPIKRAPALRFAPPVPTAPRLEELHDEPRFDDPLPLDQRDEIPPPPSDSEPPASSEPTPPSSAPASPAALESSDHAPPTTRQPAPVRARRRPKPPQPQESLMSSLRARALHGAAAALRELPDVELAQIPLSDEERAAALRLLPDERLVALVNGLPEAEPSPAPVKVKAKKPAAKSAPRARTSGELADDEEKALAFLRRARGDVRSSAVAKLLDCSPPTARRKLQALVVRGLATHKGDNSQSVYRAVS